MSTDYPTDPFLSPKFILTVSRYADTPFYLMDVTHIPQNSAFGGVQFNAFCGGGHSQGCVAIQSQNIVITTKLARLLDRTRITELSSSSRNSAIGKIYYHAAENYGFNLT